MSESWVTDGQMQRKEEEMLHRDFSPFSVRWPRCYYSALEMTFLTFTCWRLEVVKVQLWPNVHDLNHCRLKQSVCERERARSCPVFVIESVVWLGRCCHRSERSHASHSHVEVRRVWLSVVRWEISVHVPAPLIGLDIRNRLLVCSSAISLYSHV